LELLVKERTNEIQSKNDQLKALNSTKDKLFSVISHDLRSPFNAILGFGELLASNYDELSDKERKNMIGQLQSTTKQVYSLVENLLNWANIQTNNIHYQPVAFNLNELILEKLNLYRDIAKSKGIILDFELQDSLVAFADINLLETSMRNLINNAIKFTHSGGTIHVKTSQQPGFIRISVIDSGTGMTQEQINTLFNMEKTQIKRGTKGEKGSGLGLLLCKEFVERNKGSISVESQLGKGSTFSFTVPSKAQK
jgi:signal transduction histidine kinase